MREISCVLEEEDLIDSKDLNILSVTDVMCYKYARLILCDDNQHRFTVTT
jgi:hypothetical protein